MALEIVKLQATGNDFVFVDGRDDLPGAFAKISRAELVRKICDRNFGIGSDGMVFVEEVGGRYRWDFYNTDGSHAEMCGNATRCMGRWASDKLGLTKIEFTTIAGQVRVEQRGDFFASYLEFVKPSFEDIKLPNRTVIFTNTGVPHAVVRVDRLEESKELGGLIQTLRFHPQTGARGANVTFLEVVSPTEFKTVTFERGVEGFTLSCGTGIVAAAAVGLRGGTALSAQVTAPGGKLEVHFEKDFQGVTLVGPAKKVFESNLEEEFLK